MTRSVVRSFAAGVVCVALVGALAPVVVAASWTSNAETAAPPQADAELTPTPSPTPSPAPTPAPSPTATPTPFDETVAVVTALSMLDADGDLDTTADRVLFEGQWDFEADFGTAIVLSSNPSSNGSEQAYWTIDYDIEAPIRVTDQVPVDYTLLDVECDATASTVEWAVQETSVIGQVSGQGPHGLNCTFIHFTSLGGSIQAIKLVDPDANPNTNNSVFSSIPFTFSIELDNAEVFVEGPTSVDGNPAIWGIEFTAPSTRVVITEVPRDGLELVRADCYDFEIEEKVVPVTINRNTLSFEALRPAPGVESSGQYACDVVNAPTGDAADVTLPPTDAGASLSRRTGSWPALLLLAVAGSIGVLVWTSRLRRRNAR